MSLEANFGSAEEFSSFNDVKGEIDLHPDETHAGVYSLAMILSNNLNQFELTMVLIVTKAAQDESLNEKIS